MHQLETLMAQKFHNGGRTYAVGQAETDAELASVMALSATLEEENPRFDRARFLAAAGVQS